MAEIKSCRQGLKSTTLVLAYTSAFSEGSDSRASCVFVSSGHSPHGSRSGWRAHSLRAHLFSEHGGARRFVQSNRDSRAAAAARATSRNKFTPTEKLARKQIPCRGSRQLPMRSTSPCQPVVPTTMFLPALTQGRYCPTTQLGMVKIQSRHHVAELLPPVRAYSRQFSAAPTT